MANFKLEASKLLAGLEQTDGKLDIALKAYAKNAAVKLQNYARDNARWTDRTGDARKRLSGSTSKISNGQRVYLSHGVSYGIDLELAHEKKYAIIEQTIDYVGAQEIMPGLNNFFDKVKGR